MKVLLLFEYASLNGGEHSLLCLLPPLIDSGIEFLAAAPSEGALAHALTARGIPVIPWEATSASGERLSQDARRERLAAILAEAKPDLVHANSLAMTRLSGPVVAAAGYPSLGHIRDIVGLSKRAVRDVNCHTRLVAVSHATRDWHLAGGIEADRITVAYNGIDLTQFQPQPTNGRLREKFHIPTESLLLGGVGQIGIRKGWDLLLESLQLLDMRQADSHLVIAGERHSTKQEAIEYEQQLQRIASRASLAGRIHFAGRLEDMPAFYQEIDLLVHPARQEPLGRVLLEAAACGVPIIATAVGGTREIFPAAGEFQQCKAAWIVPSDDAQQLAEAIQAALASAEGRRSRGERAREVIAAHFNQAEAARRLGDIYRELLA